MISMTLNAVVLELPLLKPYLGVTHGGTGYVVPMIILSETLGSKKNS